MFSQHHRPRNMLVEEQKDEESQRSPFYQQERSFLIPPVNGAASSPHGLKRSLPVPNPFLQRHYQQKVQSESPQHSVLLVREAHVSLEVLNPDPGSHDRKSTPVVAMFNLVATVCGGGVLSLPLAFSRAGIVPTTLLMVYAATATDFSLYLLVASARRTGGRTYGDVAQAAFGSAAQIVTTVTLAIMLCGSLIAYQVLVRDVWGGVVFGLFSNLAEVAQQRAGWDERQASNVLLGLILLIALPLLLKRDLHALRHTCYVGFFSCFLLMIAVVYRATERVGLSVDWEYAATSSGLNDKPQSSVDDDNSDDDDSYYSMRSIRWYSTDPADLLFAFPMVALCFFCSYNVLSVHSQLVNPTRQRVRSVLDSSMLICFGLFYAVGLGGYLYAGHATADNILLNFNVADPAILAGRSGFCLTLMFGLPLILLPCREAVLSLPEQVATWKRDVAAVENYRKVEQERRQGAHLVVNGVDFDESEPCLIVDDPTERHGAMLKYGSNASSIGSVLEEVVKPPERPSWIEATIHFLTTLAILGVTFTVACLVPGVAAVWSIFGSSMAIWIAFIVPTACYLKIREHKGLTLLAAWAWLLLIVSCIAAPVCTWQAVKNLLVAAPA